MMARLKSVYLKIAGAAAAIAAGAYVLTRDSASGCSEEAFRKKVVDAARSELGKKYLDKYFRDAAPQFVGQHPSWCGIFALWSLHQAGLALAVKWKTGVGFLRAADITTDPKPGDVAYYDQYQHQAIVAAVHGDTVDLINGNGQGGVVALSTPLKSKARAYYSIAGYIKAAQENC